MPPDSPITDSPSTPLSDSSLDSPHSFEEKLREMILHNSTDQGRSFHEPALMLPLPISVSPHYEGQLPYDMNYGLSRNVVPSSGLTRRFLQGHSSLDPIPPFSFDTVTSYQPHLNPLNGSGSPGIPQPSPQFGTTPSRSHAPQLPSALGPQFFPDGRLVVSSSSGAPPPDSLYPPNPYPDLQLEHQRRPHYGQQIPLQAQPLVPSSSPHPNQVPPHQYSGPRHQSRQSQQSHPYYGQDITPQLHEPLPPGQGELHTLPQAVGCNDNRGTVQCNPPEPLETSLEHFPPLGTERSKSISLPPQPHQPRTPQMATHRQPQQRNQYHQFQSHPRNPNPPHPSRAIFRGPNQYPTPGRSRKAPAGPEYSVAEQNKTLEEFSKRIIAEATPEESEMALKWKLLDRCKEICTRVYPQAELVPFGSLVTGFATTNSDIDAVLTGEFYLNTVIAGSSNSKPQRLEQEFLKEGFEVTLLTKTRVPILKLVQKADDENPSELHCDIGFNNPLGVHNTRMLRTYAMCDSRVQDMVLFVKWWAKKRQINSPYHGTLSSYGYALMIIHFLTNIVKPPVLTNLQTRSIPEDADAKDVFHDDGELEDPYCIWYTKDTQSLPKLSNKMHIGQLLREFFEYYAFNFSWERDVVSIRTHGGLLTKQEKGWVIAVWRRGREKDSQVKDRYLFAVEDPFETPHNVGRTCNVSGVARIKEEFRRAVRLMRFRDGGKTMTDCLCLEEPERAWVRKEDQVNRANGPGATSNDARAGGGGRVGPPGNGDYRGR